MLPVKWKRPSKGRAAQNFLINVQTDILAAFLVPTFINENQIMIEMQGDNVLIKIRLPIVLPGHLLVVQSIRQPLEKVHRRVGVAQIIAITAKLWPIGRLSILNYIDAALSKKRKERAEGGNNVLVHVATIINYDVQSAHLFHNLTKKIGIVLTPPEYSNPMFLELCFVVDIK